MMFEEAPVGESERSAALDGWVESFDREMEQSGDFAKSVAAMRTHGCFDVRAVAERWLLANPTGAVMVVQVQPEVQEPVPLLLAVGDPPAPDETSDEARAEVPVPQEPVVDPERTSRRPEAASSPDVAYFHSLLHGGIERAEIDEAFPGFQLVIDEAVGQYEAGTAPILSDIPAPPSREDLNDEIRGMRQKLQASATRGRRRWRARD
jgi:hypothetical protein